MRKLTISLMLLLMVGSSFIIAYGATPGKLTIWTDAQQYDPIKKAAEGFSDDYGIEVEVTEVPFGDMRSKFAKAGPAGKGPDLLVGAHDWTGEFAQNGLIKSLLLDKNKKQKFVDKSLEGFTYEGKIWGLPYAIESIALIYNKELVKDPPKTWESLIKLARELTKAEKKKYGFVYPGAGDTYHTFPFISAFGGYIFKYEEGKGFNPDKIGLATEGAYEGLRIMDKMYEEGLIPKGIDYSTASSLFNAGDAAMFVTGPWAVSGIRKAGIDIGVAPLPTMDGHQPKPFMGAQGFFLSAFTENRVLAHEFLKNYLASEEVMLSLYEVGARPPAYLPALNQLDDKPIVQAFAESAKNGIPMPNIPEMGAVWGQTNSKLQLIAQQKLSVKEAMKQAQEGIQKALGEK